MPTASWRSECSACCCARYLGGIKKVRSHHDANVLGGHQRGLLVRNHPCQRVDEPEEQGAIRFWGIERAFAGLNELLGSNHGQQANRHLAKPDFDERGRNVRVVERSSEIQLGALALEKAFNVKELVLVRRQAEDSSAAQTTKPPQLLAEKHQHAWNGTLIASNLLALDVLQSRSKALSKRSLRQVLFWRLLGPRCRRVDL
eukprot:scaffold731_cov261-Pinguiococcus_pyrenoidosus.AAC.33